VPTLHQNDEKSVHHLLVAIEPNRISEPLVRWTHRFASHLGCPWTAVYVQASSNVSQADQLSITQSLNLARELGAEVITTREADVVSGLLRTAAGRNISQIIVGKPVAGRFSGFFREDKALRSLITRSGEIDIHVVRIPGPSSRRPSALSSVGRLPAKEYLLAIGVVATMIGAGELLNPFMGYRAIAWFFLTAVTALALFVGRGPILLAATLSALSWDYFFEMPLYSFYISAPEDQELFACYFIVALVLGQLTSRIRRQEKAEREREERTQARYQLSRELTAADGLDDMIRKAVNHIERRFSARMAVLLPVSSGRLVPHPASAFALSNEEHSVADQTMDRSGQSNGSDQLAKTGITFISLRAHGESEGLAAIRFDEFPISLHERNLLDDHIEQISIALHRWRAREISEMARISEQSERLSKTLLDAMAHEVRTPLAAIQSATSNLVQFGNDGMSVGHYSMISEIQEATERLNRLIGKIMHITRLESGHVKPKLELQEVGDLIRVAEHETRSELQRHNFKIEIAPGLPEVSMDFQLMLYALTNLLSNAAHHTPENTQVRLRASIADSSLILAVEDAGPGIPANLVRNLFSKFSRGPSARPGGVGLGLSLVKGFVEAQGGKVSASNRPQGGAVFTIRMPLHSPNCRPAPVEETQGLVS